MGERTSRRSEEQISPLCPPPQPSFLHYLSESCDIIRQTDVQYQNCARGQPSHKPEIVGKMLALCSHEYLPSCHHEETSFERVRIKPSLPVLLGQIGKGELLFGADN